MPAIRKSRQGNRRRRLWPLSQEGAAMLVLSRLRDESVMIGNDVEVKVVDIRGDKVRLGFLAPRSVSVDRKEIHEQKQSRPPLMISPEERQQMDQFLRAAI